VTKIYSGKMSRNLVRERVSLAARKLRVALPPRATK
jgi:hypothetical protein